MLIHFFFAERKLSKYGSLSSVSNEPISTSYMTNVLEFLKYQTTRSSTVRAYYNIWKNFNKFIIRLDQKPTCWESGTCLYGAFLVENGAQSATLKSYFSAIKKILINDNYHWDDSLVLLNSLMKACQLKYDRLTTHLPIRTGLLEMILFETERICKKQWYLEVLYKTILLISFHGLLRIGEVTQGNHVIKAKDVHIGINKDKLLLMLYTSKTHTLGTKPQEIKIIANDSNYIRFKKKHFFCPFKVTRSYINLRGAYEEDEEQFFIFKDRSPVKPHHVHSVLKQAIQNINLDSDLYNFHSLRIGMATEMIRVGCPIKLVKKLGRWKSNTVYKYIK